MLRVAFLVDKFVLALLRIIHITASVVNLAGSAASSVCFEINSKVLPHSCFYDVLGDTDKAILLVARFALSSKNNYRKSHFCQLYPLLKVSFPQGVICCF